MGSGKDSRSGNSVPLLLVKLCPVSLHFQGFTAHRGLDLPCKTGRAEQGKNNLSARKEPHRLSQTGKSRETPLPPPEARDQREEVDYGPGKKELAKIGWER